MADLDAVMAVVGQLGVIYSKEVDKELAESWVPLLEDLAPDDLFRAAKEHARESAFFPRPSELRARALRVDDMPSGEEAWLEVKRAVSSVGFYGSPSFSHEEVANAVEAIGWESHCSMPVSGQSAERAHFMRVYGAFREKVSKALQIGRVSPSISGLIEGIGDIPK